MDKGEPVRWNGKTYWATPCSEVPGYYYLKDGAGHKYFVPESEFDNSMNGLVAVVDWFHIAAKEKSK
jgi:hypothetical protein